MDPYVYFKKHLYSKFLMLCLTSVQNSYKNSNEKVVPIVIVRHLYLMYLQNFSYFLYIGVVSDNGLLNSIP